MCQHISVAPFFCFALSNSVTTVIRDRYIATALSINATKSNSLKSMQLMLEGGYNPMENLKVKSKVHDPPNLIPGIGVRCFAKKRTLPAKKNPYIAILLFDPSSPPPGN